MTFSLQNMAIGMVEGFGRVWTAAMRRDEMKSGVVLVVVCEY
jgi:hypothetical protein